MTGGRSVMNMRGGGGQAAFKVAFVLLLVRLLALLTDEAHASTCGVTEPRSRVAIMTIATGDKYARMGRLAHLNHRRYATEQGFDYLDCGEYRDDVLPGPWWKVLALIEQLPRYEWIMWMDADSLVCNWRLDVREFIGDAVEDGVHVVAAADIADSLFNTGVFWIRNSSWSVTFLRRVVSRGRADSFVRHHGWYEQLAMQHLYRDSPDVRSRFRIIPNSKRHLFNSYIMDNSFRRPGMGVIHDAGCRFRIDPAACQDWFEVYYCMCSPEKDLDPECAGRRRRGA